MTLDQIRSQFETILGNNNVLTAPGDQAPYLVEWRDKFIGNTPMVLRPGSTEEVSAIMKLAYQHGLKVVPQGGNTGLVGGQIPVPDSGEIVISLNRLNKIRSVDASGYTMSVDAGVTLQAIHDAAEQADRLFPLTLASQGTCQIGGNISTNAGGTAVLSYGNTRDLILGLEVVLANGEIWNGLRTLRKDNTGYDLKQLFIGSEGTLGIVTAASVKLFPRPVATHVSFCGLDSPHKALELFSLARSHAGTMLTGFEIMPRVGMEFALKHLPGARMPLSEAANWYILMEISAGSPDIDLESMTETIFEEAFEKEMLLDAVLAQSQAQAEDFWKLRHGLSEVQKHEGGSIKHDVSVPVEKVPDFLIEAIAAVEERVPGCRPVPFGHMGDGNIHFNITQPEGADKAAFLARWDEVNELVHGIVATYNGSISAEHGIGRLKKDLLPDVKSQVEMDLMRTIKNALDPKGILSPGRIL
ncbi:FAD-binding oxidoreductase [Rhodobacteraceae bacterium RKSG542]|uniref:FAD-binding oxidoreductase n=1 Tax=Pseudovibrio flavus TaxID=2529854 RepID=UPI0012BC5ED6|nr:FAD-binding oxidoreductase [Pseudovibrio flavus]MTI18720.1 FAD-binding oxidoreductase [Pseudovibrio flavus]